MTGATQAPTEAGTPLSPREARRQQRIETSREQILETAERLFGERGYHETGLKEVAERCEFSVGSIYSFFNSKDDLYQEVLTRRGNVQIQAMRQLATEPRPADELLVAMARLQIEYFREHPGWGRLTSRILMPGGPANAAEVPTTFQQGYRDAIEMEAAIIRRGQEDGVLGDGDPRTLARIFSAMVTAFHLMDPELTDESAGLDMDEFLSLIQHTFDSRPSPARH